ncbi:MAG: hypothetical protein SGCHY_003532 [Lobulomycetales sp.]
MGKSGHLLQSLQERVAGTGQISFHQSPLPFFSLDSFASPTPAAQPKGIAVFAALHGNDLESTHVVAQIIDALVDRLGSQDQELLDDLKGSNFTLIPQTLETTLYLVPIVNMEAYDAQKAKNLRDTCVDDPSLSGVDISRNFAFMFDQYASDEDRKELQDPCSMVYQGRRPESEPETVAIRKFFEEFHPTVSLFLHSTHDVSLESRVILPFTFLPTDADSNGIRDEDMEGFQLILRQLNTPSPDLFKSGFARDLLHQSIPGSEIDWAFATQNSYAVRVETGSNTPLHADAILSLAKIAPALAPLTAISSTSLISSTYTTVLVRGPQVLALLLLIVGALGLLFAKWRGVGMARVWKNVRDSWAEFGKYRGYQGIKSSDSTEEFSLGERVFPDAAGTRDDDVDVIDVFQEGEVSQILSLKPSQGSTFCTLLDSVSKKYSTNEAVRMNLGFGHQLAATLPQVVLFAMDSFLYDKRNGETVFPKEALAALPVSVAYQDNTWKVSVAGRDIQLVSDGDTKAKEQKRKELEAALMSSDPSSNTDIWKSLENVGEYLRIFRKYLELADAYPENEQTASDFKRIRQIMFPLIDEKLFSRHAFSGAGIVMCLGSENNVHVEHGYSSLKAIREVHKSDLPMEVFYLGEKDSLSEKDRKLFESIPNLRVVDITDLILDRKDIGMVGWYMKPFAMWASSFEHVILLDADCNLLQSPDVLLKSPKYHSAGALFFYDREMGGGRGNGPNWIRSMLTDPTSLDYLGYMKGYMGFVQETGLVMINKQRNLAGLVASCVFFFEENLKRQLGKYTHGEKEAFWIGFEITGNTFAWASEHKVAAIGSAKKHGKLNEICSVQMMHLDEFDKPLWINGGLSENKHHSQVELKEMKQYVHEPGVWASAWFWDSGDPYICLQTSQTPIDFTVEERRIIQEQGNLYLDFVKSNRT